MEGVAGGDQTYSQEQDDLKASFKAAAELEEGVLLVPRNKTQEEKVFADQDGCGH